VGLAEIIHCLFWEIPFRRWPDAPPALTKHRSKKLFCMLSKGINCHLGFSNPQGVQAGWLAATFALAEPVLLGVLLRFLASSLVSPGFSVASLLHLACLGSSAPMLGLHSASGFRRRNFAGALAGALQAASLNLGTSLEGSLRTQVLLAELL